MARRATVRRLAGAHLHDETERFRIKSPTPWRTAVLRSRPHHVSVPPRARCRPITASCRDGTSLDLPAPPPFNFRNMLTVIGPGAIMAATSIGGGEWLVGPAAAVKYSSAIFLIATVAIVLQVIFNLEAIRYTLYTGEPIYGGIMRLKPGPRFWAGVLQRPRILSAGLAGARRERGGHAVRRLDGPHAGRAGPARRRPGSPRG